MELINGRTPEDIKRALEWMTNGCPTPETDCEECRHHEICKEITSVYTPDDALAYIKHLEAKQPKWISVKERLPENEKVVLTAGWREGISGKLWPVVMTAFHMDGKMLAQDTSYSWSEGNVEMEYDEDADDFIIPEGWFEDVQCADEFSMVDDIKVTHWMPLPQPPEEDE